MQDSSIAQRGWQCNISFTKILSGNVKEKSTLQISRVTEEYTRFRLWAGNIGALQEGSLSTSLQHRLREVPNVIKQVIRLLTDLDLALCSLTPIIAGEKLNRQGTASQLVNESGVAESSSSYGSAFQKSEAEVLLFVVSRSITNLFELSTLIRSARKRDIYERADVVASERADPFPEYIDILYIKDSVKYRYPRLDGKSWLIERLGKAITRRREALRYCEEHQRRREMKAGAGLQEETDRNTIGKTIASSMDAKVLTQSIDEVAMSETQTESFDDTRSTASSYDSTLGVGEEETDKLYRVIDLDEVNNGLPEFECPCCHIAQHITNRREWKKHVFHDLRPYVCTFRECSMKMFSRRQDWFNHECEVHRLQWLCPVCQIVISTGQQDFFEHIRGNHFENFTDDQLETLSKVSRQPAQMFRGRDCPMCSKWEDNLKTLGKDQVTSKQFYRHVGGHMEQLALSVAPWEAYHNDDGSNSDTDDDNGDGDRRRSRDQQEVRLQVEVSAMSADRRRRRDEQEVRLEEEVRAIRAERRRRAEREERKARQNAEISARPVDQAGLTEADQPEWLQDMVQNMDLSAKGERVIAEAVAEQRPRERDQEEFLDLEGIAEEVRRKSLRRSFTFSGGDGSGSGNRSSGSGTAGAGRRWERSSSRNLDALL